MMQVQGESIGKPAMSLALTFVLIGLTFAIPVRLLPPDQVSGLSSDMALEVGNVYAVVAWAGLSHFFFAYRGQFSALRNRGSSQVFRYIALVVATVVGLAFARQLVGVGLFGVVTWTYFIFHFHKAETFFDGRKSAWSEWRDPFHVIVSFAWLTAVLLNAGRVIQTPWIIWLVSLAIGCLVLADGGLKRLMDGEAKNSLLSIFFVAESLVWGTYGRYGGTAFLFGVYVFHIAAGSYYHYMGSYFAAFSRSRGADKWLRLGAIALVNGLFIAVGIVANSSASMSFLRPLFGVQWFTLWVAVHLVTSDLFPLIRGNRAG